MSSDPKVVVFESKLGWFAVVGRGEVVMRASFAHPNARAAREAVNAVDIDDAPARHPLQAIGKRLAAYAAGKPDDFRDVEIDLGEQTKFQRRVIDACRKIGIGQDLSYGELAVKAGTPGAARAVGNVMARNRVPIIVPCHRVLAAGGRIGGYSMRAGIGLKRRLLALERHPRFQ